MVLIALNPDGSYYTPFGSSGIAAVNIGNNGDGGRAGFAFGPNGQIALAELLDKGKLSVL